MQPCDMGVWSGLIPRPLVAAGMFYSWTWDIYGGLQCIISIMYSAHNTCMTFGSILYRIGIKRSMKCQISRTQDRWETSFLAQCNCIWPEKSNSHCSIYRTKNDCSSKASGVPHVLDFSSAAENKQKSWKSLFFFCFFFRLKHFPFKDCQKFHMLSFTLFGQHRTYHN